jgi:hypothetical protein
MANDKSRKSRTGRHEARNSRSTRAAANMLFQFNLDRLGMQAIDKETEQSRNRAGSVRHARCRLNFKKVLCMESVNE